MATEYISKTDAIHVARYAAKTGKDVAGYIEHLPAAAVVEVVPGEWIKMDMHRGMENYKCSVCRSETYVPEHGGEPMYVFCPNCGAKMSPTSVSVTNGGGPDAVD